MPTIDDEQGNKGIFNGDTLEEALYGQMKESFIAAVEGEDLHPAVERAVIHLYLGEVTQKTVADSFKKCMDKSDGPNIVKAAMSDWRRNCKDEINTFAKQDKAHKREGGKLRDYWAA